MLDLEAVLKEWNSDAEISEHELDKASRHTPKLHAKYLQYLSLAKLSLKRAENAQKILLKEKFLYYSGKMDPQTLKDKGWSPDPFDGLKVLKGDLDHWYEADPEIQQSEDRIVYLKTLIDTLNEIVQTLRWRHATIKNVIDWRRLESGG